MAHGIVARFPGEPLAIVGLLSQGDVIARRLVDKVKELGVEAQYGSIDISLYRDDIFKLEARPSLRSSNLPFSTDDMRVVLVDDVMTSGASLHTAAAVLRQAGVAHITGMVVARTEAGRQDHAITSHHG